jgi:hypothetical protein
MPTIPKEANRRGLYSNNKHFASPRAFLGKNRLEGRTGACQGVENE